MIRTSTYIPPIEPLVIMQAAFSIEQCDKIRRQVAEQRFIDARVGAGVLDQAVRETDLIWLEPSEQTEWVFKHMNDLQARVNFDKFQMALDGFDGFQFSKYKIDGHYDWHVDTQNNPASGLFRKLSFVLMLSNPDDYEGGDFLICPDGNNEKATRLRLNKGDLLVFYSHIAHKVCPVTSGDRYTLVTWALGPKPQ